MWSSFAILLSTAGLKEELERLTSSVESKSCKGQAKPKGPRQYFGAFLSAWSTDYDHHLFLMVWSSSAIALAVVPTQLFIWQKRHLTHHDFASTSEEHEWKTMLCKSKSIVYRTVLSSETLSSKSIEWSPLPYKSHILRLPNSSYVFYIQVIINFHSIQY